MTTPAMAMLLARAADASAAVMDCRYKADDAEMGDGEAWGKGGIQMEGGGKGGGHSPASTCLRVRRSFHVRHAKIEARAMRQAGITQPPTAALTCHR